MPRRRRQSPYPRTVAEVLDENMRFRPATIQALLHFKHSAPWRGSFWQRKAKLRRLHQELCRIYGKRTRLSFGRLDGSSSGSSSYDRGGDAISVRGRLSVVTYLHEFAHALRKDECDTRRWSINLFKRCFPRQFARCRCEGHMLFSRRRRSRDDSS